MFVHETRYDVLFFQPIGGFRRFFFFRMPWIISGRTGNNEGNPSRAIADICLDGLDFVLFFFCLFFFSLSADNKNRTRTRRQRLAFPVLFIFLMNFVPFHLIEDSSVYWKKNDWIQTKNGNAAHQSKKENWWNNGKKLKDEAPFSISSGISATARNRGIGGVPETFFFLLLLLFYLRERQVWACLISFMKPFIRCICRKSSTAPFLFVSAAREKGKHPQFVIIIIIFLNDPIKSKGTLPFPLRLPRHYRVFFYRVLCSTVFYGVFRDLLSIFFMLNQLLMVLIGFQTISMVYPV